MRQKIRVSLGFFNAACGRRCLIETLGERRHRLAANVAKLLELLRKE
jgi:hypothetical protein